MKQIFNLICCVLFFCLLCGFQAGVDLEDSDKASNEPVAPVIEYEETVSASKSNLELYQQYHLLIITSLEEASNIVTDDQQWAFRLAQSAYKYVTLLDNLLNDNRKGTFEAVGEDLKALTLSIKSGNLITEKKKRISHNLKAMAKDFKSKYNLKKVQTWIKN